MQISVVPAPGIILKETSTMTDGAIATLSGAAYSDYASWTVLGAGIHVTNIDSIDLNLVTSTGPRGDFMIKVPAGRYFFAINHLDYNRFGPITIELKPGEHRDIQIDLNNDASYVRTDTLRFKKRLSHDEIRRQVIDRDLRLQTAPRDSISIRLVNAGAK